MDLHLITAEDPLTLEARARELIRMPQLTMPLLAALTPNIGYMRGLTGEIRARAAMHME